MFVYKIKSAKGTFSTGGSEPTFTSKGKSWTSRGHLTNHLLRFIKKRKFEKYYKDCEVVLYELTEAASVDLSKGISEGITQFRDVFDPAIEGPSTEVVFEASEDILNETEETSGDFTSEEIEQAKHEVEPEVVTSAW